MTPLHHGSCHCGLVRFRVSGEPSGVVACTCSICRKKGYLHWIVPPERFELVSGADALTTYRFGTGVAQHHFCRSCGMHPFYVPRSDPDKIDVNVRCLDDVDLTTIEIGTFDGQSWEESIQGHLPWRELFAAKPLREASVVATEVLTGEDGPEYGRTAEETTR